MADGDKFKIVQTVASGGTAVLYKAVQVSLDRIVAIKRLHQHLTSDENFTRRFILEAKAAASLDHENIVSVIDFGKDEDAYQMVMEYVEGDSLKEVLDRWRPIQHELALAIVHQVCLGLEHAHAKGIVHRDIKPGNLMLTTGGKVKIADFGLAKLTESNTSQTAVNSILGTPLYMSPEQAFGESVDHRSDLFSLGTVLYELLTGQQPFAGENYMGVIQNIINRNVPSVRTTVPDVPANVAAIVDKALSKERKARFQSARQFREAIEDVLGLVRLNRLNDSLRTLLHTATNTHIISQVRERPVRRQKRRTSRLGVAALVTFLLVGAGTTTLLLKPELLEQVRTLVEGVTGTSATPPIQQAGASPDARYGFDFASIVPEATGDTVKDTVFVTRTQRDTVVVKVETPVPVAAEPEPEPKKEKPREPAIRYGYVDVSSTPSAEIHVDGVYKGDTPAKLRLTSGGHSIEIRHPKYEPYSERLNVITNELSRRTVVLKKLRGAIAVHTIDGAELHVDGKLVARTPLLNPLELDAGPHMVMIRKDGYLSWSSEVTVEPKATLPLHITLSPKY